MLTQRTLGRNGPALPAIGLGCMGMSEFYGQRDDKTSMQVLDRAYDLGVRHFDTADIYGSGHNEELLSGFLGRHAGDLFVATKFGIRRVDGAYERVIDNSPDYIRSACEASLTRLGIETIDLYYAHRVNTETPIEETVGALSRLVDEGKIRHIGLCEVSADTLRRAHATHPISALQTEYSLTTRDVEAEILPACRALDIAFVAYSPLGRGLLSGTITSADGLDQSDFRRLSPRFGGDNLARNLDRLGALKRIAAGRGVTPAQVALAWLLAQGDDIFAIPGTKRISYLEDNVAAGDIDLTSEELAALSDAMPVGSVHGERYPEAGRVGLNA
ncbi:MAG: aldo/keto reductase [Minwuiales bacterium]|nr:aldo/keto reductase [Minwuiales bacterium]